MRTATGVGVMFNPAVFEVLELFPQAVDYVEVMPETFWTDRGRRAATRYEQVAAAHAELASVADRYPLAIHAIGLSIGSATPLDEQHLRQLRRFADTFGVERFSEHLGFNRVTGHSADDRHVGMGFPIPCDEAVLTWMTERVHCAMELLDRQVIFENGVRHTPYIDEDMTEPEFLNRLAASTGCGVLLDLHNLHTDHRNGGDDPNQYVEQLDLGLVREIHVAGGSTVGRAYTDSHAGPCPPEVWELLATVAPQCPNLEGVTFEFHQSYYPTLGPDGVARQLETVRQVWPQREACDVA